LKKYNIGIQVGLQVKAKPAVRQGRKATGSLIDSEMDNRVALIKGSPVFLFDFSKARAKE
jgi:hypothetical protein